MKMISAILLSALTVLIPLQVLADEVVEKQALVCVTANETVYGVAITRHRSANYDKWFGTLFSEGAKAEYEAGTSFSDLEAPLFSSDYNGSYPEFTATLDGDGSTVKLYSCKKLNFTDRFIGEADWYEMLKAYLY